MGLDEKKCKLIKRALVGFALVVTIAVIIIMVVDSATEEASSKNQSVTCIKSTSYDLSSLSCSDYPCITEYQSYIDTLATDTESWDNQQSTEFLQTFHETDLGQCIQNVNTSCQLRPAPSCYLPSNIIEHHLSTFYKYGASYIANTKYAAMTNFSELGYEPDEYDQNGVQWVGAYNQDTYLLQNCGDDASSSGTSSNADDDTNILDPADCVLTALGIEIGDEDMFRYDWGNPTVINRVMLVNVFNTSLMELNLRMASGNEQGTDELWRPGGYTFDGAMEAVVDMIMEGDYCWNGIAQPNGEFCFDSCEIECDNLGGCFENSCVNIL